MITLHRLAHNDEAIHLNPDLIQSVEACPDTVLRLASGQLSHDYIDGKFAVDTGERLTIVSRAVADLAARHGIEFDAVGGLTMGADPLAHGVAMVTGKAWFSVRVWRAQVLAEAMAVPAVA